jgi:hypothetical protein
MLKREKGKWEEFAVKMAWPVAFGVYVTQCYLANIRHSTLSTGCGMKEDAFRNNTVGNCVFS